jgi:hypothetical protein
MYPVSRSLAISIFAGLAFIAQADDARHLGSTRLSHAENDADVIRTECTPPVRAIKIRAARGAIEIQALWVRYGNGERDRLEVRERLAEGSESRWIDLRGGERCVREIGIIGDTEVSLDRARVDVFGR